jgi:23S rRNA-/tRNA-specific pseudouridylate synthase
MYKIIFENENFLVVDKPSNWLTIPGRLGEKDQRPCLGLTLQKDFGQKIYPVHRLDLEVSGLVVFARNSTAHKAANEWFEDKIIQKKYVALSEGSAEEALKFSEPTLWKSKLLRGKKRTYESPQGKPSETRAQYIEAVRLPAGEVLRWELEPLTGRSHQLRVEMAKHGFVVAGDTLYGAKIELVPELGIYLRAYSLSLKSVEERNRFGMPEEIVIQKF